MSRRSGSVALALALALGAGVGPARAEDAAREGAAGLGISIRSDQPMQIDAEELEAVRDQNGGERVTFRRAVRARQGDLDLRCDWLEALYPEGGGRGPVRITARGSVRATQGDTAVACTEMVYDERDCRLTCSSSTGPAVVRRGEDVIRGREIAFDLCKGALKVKGGAQVQVRPEAEPAPQEASE